jgi:hypothetical protein
MSNTSVADGAPTRAENTQARSTKGPGILIAGHSHAYALGLPGAKADAQPELVDIAPGFQGLVGPWPRDDGYWDALVQKAKEGELIVALSFLGNDHLAHFLIEEAPFDFISATDEEGDVRKGVEIIPEARLRDVFKEHSSRLPAILNKLSTAGVRTLVLGTPPPKENLQSRLTTEPFFIKRLEGLGHSIETVELCPSPLQLKLWKLLQTMLEEAAVMNGATFIPYPRALMNEGGYLKQQFARNDVTHANDAAGAFFRDELAARTAQV